MDDIDLRRELENLGAERRANQEAGHAIMLKIANVAPQAVSAGISKAEIARRANISMPTLYAILDD